MHPVTIPDPKGEIPDTSQFVSGNTELVALVRSCLPQRFYPKEPWWSPFCAASVVRMADTVEAITELAESKHSNDLLSLLRSLYEQAVTLAWILIAPDQNFARWVDSAKIQVLKLHNETVAFGESILTANEVSEAEQAVGMPGVDVRASQVDQHWASRIEGFYPSTHLFSWRGLYTSIYRMGSRPMHSSIESLDLYISRPVEPVVVNLAKPGPAIWFALSTPVFTMGLAVAAERFRWIDRERVREINDRTIIPDKALGQATGD